MEAVIRLDWHLNPLRRWLAAAALAALTTTVLGSSARADVTVLGVLDDAFIADEAPDNNAGGCPHLSVGTSGTLTTRRGLLLFDLSSIPPGSTVNSVSLRVDVVGLPLFGSVDSNFSVFRLVSPWTEGIQTCAITGSGSPASSGEVTWNSSMHAVTAWSSPGGDFVAAPSATTFVTGIGTYTWTGAQLAADVQSFVDNPAANDGWILRTDSEGVSRAARKFGSREGSAGAQLTVDFTPPAQAVPAVSDFAAWLLGTALLAVGALVASVARGARQRSFSPTKPS